MEIKILLNRWTSLIIIIGRNLPWHEDCEKTKRFISVCKEYYGNDGDIIEQVLIFPKKRSNHVR